MIDVLVKASLLKLALRIGGAVTTAAFLAALLPIDWMATAHQKFGLGEFPRAPITDYLARSVSLLYGFHGADDHRRP